MATDAAADLANRLEHQMTLQNYVEGLDLADANARLHIANAVYQAACGLLAKAYRTMHLPKDQHYPDYEKGCWLFAIARKIRDAPNQGAAQPANAAPQAFGEMVQEFQNMTLEALKRAFDDIQDQNAEIGEALGKSSLKQASATLMDEGVRETIEHLRAKQAQREKDREKFTIEEDENMTNVEDNEDEADQRRNTLFLSDDEDIHDFAERRRRRKNGH